MEMLYISVFFLSISSLYIVSAYHPCCSFPCKNRGVCDVTVNGDYTCDCTNTGYYGNQCERAYWGTWIKTKIRPDPETLHHVLINYKPLWDFVNSMLWLRKTIMKAVLKIRIALVPSPAPLSGFHGYAHVESYYNHSLYYRTLPPVPENCPTPMGTAGPVKLPDIMEVSKKVLLRPEKFIPCPIRTNLMFPFHAQHFTHQFFKTDKKNMFPYQWGEHSISMYHIYGHTAERRRALRTFSGGKLKHSVINGEVFPPRFGDMENFEMTFADKMPPGTAFALGHPWFNLLPHLVYWNTLFLREHNRVCDILAKEHPHWDDERLYATAQFILIGEQIKIVVEEYVQHTSGYNFKLLYDPEIMYDTGISYNNQIHMEFNMMYRWHGLVPGKMEFGNKTYTLGEMVMNNNILTQNGMEQFTKDINRQFAGKISGGHSMDKVTLQVALESLESSRKVRLQSFNNYRAAFKLKPYTSFEQLTGDKELASILEELYVDVDAVEFYVGILVERRREKQIFGGTFIELGSPYSMLGTYGHFISSPAWWKPSTFGGEVGFNMVKGATLQKLVCDNISGCPKVAFTVPPDLQYQEPKKDEL